MNLVDNVMSLLKGKDEISTSTITGAPDGMCPNCWGRDEYSGAFYAAAKSKGVNGNNIGAHVGWVQDYANKHFSSIAIVKEDDYHMCKSCNHKEKISN